MPALANKLSKKAPPPEDEIREGSAEARPRSRKRSAKNAAHTTPAATADGDGSCGKKCSCDGCKSRRGDALTAPEYLAACDLGVQGQSRSYIRARLDTAKQLREDLKCGKGAISKGEKCTKGAATTVEQGTLGYKQSHYGLKQEAFGTINGKTLSNRQVRQVERGIVSKEARTGKKEPLTRAQGAALISTRGTASRRFVAQQLRPVKSSVLKGAIKEGENSSDPLEFAVNRAAKRELFNRRVQTGTSIAAVGGVIGAALLSRRGRKWDSVYADGFTVDSNALAV